jgi:hypothetical protein
MDHAAGEFVVLHPVCPGDLQVAEDEEGGTGAIGVEGPSSAQPSPAQFSSAQLSPV